MDIKNQGLLLQPYRSLGLFIGSLKPKIYNCGKTTYLLCPLNRSFKVYELPDMKIKLMSGDLPGNILACNARNEEILIVIKHEQT